MLQTHVQKILIIKLGALGDFIQAFSFIAAIRKAHPKAHITLLTTKPFEKFAQDSKYCDDIWIDEKPKFFNFVKCRAFQKKLNAAGFDRVYDLQNNDRTALYFKLINPKPEWVGTGRGISHRNIVDRSQVRHEFDVHIQTLAGAGIKNIKIDELNWMTGDISSFKINTPYILLTPGCAPQHSQKRWPAQSYAALAQEILKQGITPVIIGTKAEEKEAQTIQEIAPKTINLVEQTSLAQIVSLSKNAVAAVGNDTGPMHLIGASGCPSLVLFSKNSNPIRHKPKGKCVEALQRDNLADLDVKTVLESMNAIMQQ